MGPSNVPIYQIASRISHLCAVREGQHLGRLRRSISSEDIVNVRVVRESVDDDTKKHVAELLFPEDRDGKEVPERAFQQVHIVQDQHRRWIDARILIEVAPVVHDPQLLSPVEREHVRERPTVLRSLESDDGKPEGIRLAFDLLRELFVAGQVGHRLALPLSELFARQQSHESLAGPCGELDGHVSLGLGIAHKDFPLPSPQFRYLVASMVCEEGLELI